MFELTRISLENDMDLILAHKQGMKVAELARLSVAKQTSFATSVSEVCRDVISTPNNAWLSLGIKEFNSKTKSLCATVTYKKSARKTPGVEYARRLVDTLCLDEKGDMLQLEMCTGIQSSIRLDEELLQHWSILLNNDPLVSPYEEIKRKNKQLGDLTERLTISENLHKTLTDSLPIMIYTTNGGGAMMYANKYLLQYTGKTMEELNATRWKTVIHPEDFERSWNEWNAGQLALQPRHAERRLLCAETNEYKWYAGETIPAFDEQGKLVSWNGFLADVDAERKMAQTLQDNRELQDIKKMLEQKIVELNRSNQELEQFAYVASHDLQEPLRKIIYYSDYIKSKFGDQMPEQSAHYLDNIATASTRMKQLIRDVLVYSTIAEKTFTKVDLNDVFREAIQDNELAIKDKCAVIELSPMPQIDGIQPQLKQLFENLLSNALKFTQPGRPPVINVTAIELKTHVSVTIRDNGIGFEQKYIERMFDLFQRLHTRDKFAGTGIGLGICRKIVQLHNGTITATSTPGEGATFIVELPLRQVQRSE